MGDFKLHSAIVTDQVKIRGPYVLGGGGGGQKGGKKFRVFHPSNPLHLIETLAARYTKVLFQKWFRYKFGPNEGSFPSNRDVVK